MKITIKQQLTMKQINSFFGKYKKDIPIVGCHTKREI